ncbi:MAG: hypothetical protein WBA93_19660 [Microcoleaceae cyanobacterium]
MISLNSQVLMADNEFEFSQARSKNTDIDFSVHPQWNYKNG